MPRFIWIKKSWTLKELHLNFYDEFKSIITNWYKDCKDQGGKSSFHSETPPFRHPQTDEVLDYDSLTALPLDQQFEALFPSLSEETWKEETNKNSWSFEKRPYTLKVENNSGYGNDCHFCNNYNCRNSCALPYTSK